MLIYLLVVLILFLEMKFKSILTQLLVRKELVPILITMLIVLIKAIVIMVIVIVIMVIVIIMLILLIVIIMLILLILMLTRVTNQYKLILLIINKI